MRNSRNDTHKNLNKNPILFYTFIWRRIIIAQETQRRNRPQIQFSRNQNTGHLTEAKTSRHPGIIHIKLHEHETVNKRQDIKNFDQIYCEFLA